MTRKQRFIAYLKNGWNKVTITYFFSSLILYLIMFFIFRYATKLRWIDALTIVIVTCATINFFILIFRWGFAKGIINRIKEYFAERTIRRKARKSFSSDMTEHQKAQILIKERQKAQQAWIEKEKKSQNTTNNLTFYLLLLLDLVALVAMIPFLIK